jgi:methyl-accepting chemotaxis protein
LRFTIGRRLALAFGITLAFLAGLVANNLGQMKKIYDSSSYATVNTVPSLLVLDRAFGDFATLRSLANRHMQNQDPAAYAQIEKAIADKRAALGAELDRYETLISDDTDRRMLADDRALNASFVALQDKVLALSRDNRKEDARNLFVENTAAAEKLQQAFEAHRNYNDKLSQDAAAEAEAVRGRAWRTSIAGGAAALVITLLLAFWVVRSITSRLRQAVHVADAVAHDDLSSRIHSGGQDEIGDLLKALQVMQDNLRQRIDTERRVAAENLRIKNALDNVSSSVMLADNDRRVVYCNGAVMQMLKDAEADIRKELPQFRADAVVGGSIDDFHRNPDHQKRLLAGLTGTHRAQIRIGARVFNLAASPNFSAGGERTGTVVEWVDYTAEHKLRAEVTAIVQAAAAGDFSQRLAEEGKEGFFKLLAENINLLVHACNAGISEVARVLATVAQGDLTQTVQGEFQGAFGTLRDDTNRTVEQLRALVARIKEAAEAITVPAREIASGNADLSARTEQQAASLQETASSMEELTSTVRQNAENARQANQFAIGASGVAVKGGQIVSEVVDTMSRITDSSRKIADIIGVIDGIAFQTNILALNAAVEAARAGEQGRGFAVVASEVRSLAQRSASAAKEIKALIGDSVEKVTAGAALVEQAGTTMEEIVSSVKRVTDIMGEITAASQEQSAGIEQINIAITQMDQGTQQNAALVEQASAAARSMEEQSASLVGSVSSFRLLASEKSGGGTVAAPSSAAPKPQAAAQRPLRLAAGRQVARPRAAAKSEAAGKSGDGGQWTEF